MFAAILMLFAIPFTVLSELTLPVAIARHSGAHSVGFWTFIGIFFTLIFLGSNAAAEPYVTASRFFTMAYFAYFLAWVPFVAVITEKFFLSKKIRK